MTSNVRAKSGPAKASSPHLPGGEAPKKLNSFKIKAKPEIYFTSPAKENEAELAPKARLSAAERRAALQKSTAAAARLAAKERERRSEAAKKGLTTKIEDGKEVTVSKKTGDRFGRPPRNGIGREAKPPQVQTRLEPELRDALRAMAVVLRGADGNSYGTLRAMSCAMFDEFLEQHPWSYGRGINHSWTWKASSSVIKFEDGNKINREDVVLVNLQVNDEIKSKIDLAVKTINERNDAAGLPRISTSSFCYSAADWWRNTVHKGKY